MLFERKDVDVLQTLEMNTFADDYKFTFQNGFNLAVAFTAFDDEPEPILDKSYGEIVFLHSYWGETEDGETFEGW